MIRFLLALVLGCFVASAAFAQQPVTLTPNLKGQSNYDTAVTITNTHGTALAAGTYGFVEFSNQDQAAFVYCVWGGTAVATPTAGQRTFAPLSGYVWDALDPAPGGKVLDCISSASSSPATVRAY